MQLKLSQFKLIILYVTRLDLLVGLQFGAAKEIEFYGIYDPDIMNVTIAIAISKAIEYIAPIFLNFFRSLRQQKLKS